MNPNFQVKNIIRKATRKGGEAPEALNVLCMDTHESYQTTLAQTGHNFYSLQQDGAKTWDTDYRPVPPNYYRLKPDYLPAGVDFDLVLSQTKYGQFQFLSQVASYLNLPLISLEHTLPMPNMIASHLKQSRQMQAHLNVFISEFSRREWGWGENEATVIHHGIDTEVFKYEENQGRAKHALSVVNLWKDRDQACGYKLWKQIIEGLPSKVLGKNPGLSEPAKSIGDLVDHYSRSEIFLNTSLISPIPTSLLEAMSCGCAIVSTSNCMIPEIIEDGINGRLSNDRYELRSIIKNLLEDPNECRRLGNNARRTILEKFNIQNFIKNWNKAFYAVADMELAN